MVRAVDIADTLSKTELVRKINEEKKQAPEMEQRLHAEKMRKDSSDSAERTGQSEKSDMLIISDENRKKEKKSRRNKDEEPSPDEDGPQEAPGEHLDVKA